MNQLIKTSHEVKKLVHLIELKRFTDGSLFSALQNTRVNRSMFRSTFYYYGFDYNNRQYNVEQSEILPPIFPCAACASAAGRIVTHGKC
jgi:hypothetical protein